MGAWWLGQRSACRVDLGHREVGSGAACRRIERHEYEWRRLPPRQSSSWKGERRRCCQPATTLPGPAPQPNRQATPAARPLAHLSAQLPAPVQLSLRWLRCCRCLGRRRRRLRSGIAVISAVGSPAPPGACAAAAAGGCDLAGIPDSTAAIYGCCLCGDSVCAARRQPARALVAGRDAGTEARVVPCLSGQSVGWPGTKVVLPKLPVGAVAVAAACTCHRLHLLVRQAARPQVPEQHHPRGCQQQDSGSSCQQRVAVPSLL